MNSFQARFRTASKVRILISGAILAMATMNVCAVAAVAPPQAIPVKTVGAPTAVAPSSKTVKPRPVQRDIWAASWATVPTGMKHISEMMFLDGYSMPGTSSPLPSAKAMALQSLKLPPGRAALQWWRYSNSLFMPAVPDTPAFTQIAPGANLWDATSVNMVKSEWSAWLAAYKNAGGRLDLLVGDCERWGVFQSWNLNQERINAIANDRRGLAPAFGEAAFRSLLGPTNFTLVKQPYLSSDYMRWDAAVGTIARGAMMRAVWDPAAALYPTVRGSNYGGVEMSNNPAPDCNGHPQPNSNQFGTASSPVAYGQIEYAATSWFIDNQNPTSLAKTGSMHLQNTPWFSFLMDIQQGRACRRSAPTIPLQPWVAIQLWKGRIAGFVSYPSDMRYHDEMVRHYALLGTETFLYWNPTASQLGGESNWTEAERAACARRFDAAIDDINRRTLGVVDSTTTVEAVRFDARILTTGARRIDGKWIWRTTVHPDVHVLRNAFTGASVPLDASGIGRWDITDTATPPVFTEPSSRSKIVVAPTN